jgi:purine-nucleoside phosphorylase
METNVIQLLGETRSYIQQRTKVIPKVGIILGSGLGTVIESSEEDAVFHFNELPHFPSTTVHGHNGELIIGDYSGKGVAIMQGRVHFYEGYDMEHVTYPVRLMKWLGIEYLIITAATGGVNPLYKKGDIVLLKDHINLMGENPLRGQHHSWFGERFPDCTEVYSKELRKIGLSSAKKNKIRACEGVYMALSGPSYETPAEIKAFRKLGADVVGMSVVPEAVAANQMGIKVLGVAYVANLSPGVGKKILSHNDVVETGKLTASKLGKIIAGVIEAIK